MKRIIYTGILFIFLILFVSAPLFAFSLQEGNILLRFFERTGRFVPYYHTHDTQGNSITIPLVFESDPRTTLLGILIDNRYVIPADSRSFSQEFNKYHDSAIYRWCSDRIEVLQEISLISSHRGLKDQLTDGFLITITITNISSHNHNIGIHYLLDTYLGEKNNNHFKAGHNEVINNETGFSYTFPEYWVSPGSLDGYLGFQGMVLGHGLSIPDKLIFANWKRLKDSNWNMLLRESRSFNYLPYSINDSGVSYFYNPRQMKPGEFVTLKLAFGLYSESIFSLLEKEKIIYEKQEEPIDPDIFTEIEDIQKIINTYLDDVESIDFDNIEELRKQLHILRQSILDRDN